MKTEVTALGGKSLDLFEGYLTVSDVAEKLKVSPRRVRQFIGEGRLQAKKIGKQYIIAKASLGAFADKPRKVGRPAGSKNKIKVNEKE